MLKHSIFQTEVQFNAPIKSGHASGMAGNQSNHPQGNPALADTYIIQNIPVSWGDRGDMVHAGPAMYQHCATCNPPVPDWRPNPSTRSNLSSLDAAKEWVENKNKYWIDRISAKSTPTTTSGRSSTKKLTAKQKSWLSRLRKRFKRGWWNR
jgi:hypothetical protein